MDEKLKDLVRRRNKSAKDIREYIEDADRWNRTHPAEQPLEIPDFAEEKAAIAAVDAAVARGGECPCRTDLDDPGPHIASCPYADPEYAPPGFQEGARDAFGALVRERMS